VFSELKRSNADVKVLNLKVEYGIKQPFSEKTATPLKETMKFTIYKALFLSFRLKHF
jgi:hypothetical protein